MDRRYASIIKDYCDEMCNTSPMLTDIRAIKIDLPFNTTAIITDHCLALRSKMQGIEARVYFAYVMTSGSAMVFYDEHGRDMASIDIDEAYDYTVRLWEARE